MFTITESELAVLNAARTILNDLENRAQNAASELAHTEEIHPDPDAFELGRCAEVAHQAEETIFDVLNVAKNYGKAPIEL